MSFAKNGQIVSFPVVGFTKSSLTNDSLLLCNNPATRQIKLLGNPNVSVSYGKMYLSQIVKCICLKLLNIFVSNPKSSLTNDLLLLTTLATSQTKLLRNLNPPPINLTTLYFCYFNLPSKKVFLEKFHVAQENGREGG